MKIIITGGASGLGRSITDLLVEDTAHEIIITYNKSIDAAQELEKNYSNITSFKCDFNVLEQVNKFAERIEEIKPQVLINNASGPFEQVHFHKQEINYFKDIFERDILPVLIITGATLKIFRQQKFGKIINIISSAVINKPPVGWSAYTANKSYLLSMSKSWATEYINYNITSNSISPSMMHTELLKILDERMVEIIEQKHPLKKFLDPEEVAKTVKYLIDVGQHLNGTNIILNAGEELN